MPSEPNQDESFDLTFLKPRFEELLTIKFGESLKITDIAYLGSGVHGYGVKIECEVNGGKKHLVAKAIAPNGFGHEYLSDRVQVLMMAYQSYNQLPKHVRSIDVVVGNQQNLVSLGDGEEAFLLTEWAEGRPYYDDLDAIIERGSLTDTDETRSRILAEYLADIHSSPLSMPKATRKSLYRRKIREVVGHGECIMGVIDMYEASDALDCRLQCEAIIEKSIDWWWKLRDRFWRLKVVHGDFHPDNIWFKGDGDFVLLDRSRGIFGEVADDLTSILMNYFMYCCRDAGENTGNFCALAEIFLTEYFDRTEDIEAFECIPLFAAFRSLVLANPKIFPQNSPEIRRRILGYAVKLLEEDFPSRQTIISGFLE
jgi:Ser/Thr protein kinase RdoA (MazF antagonist)